MQQIAQLQAENIQFKQEIAELKLLASSLQVQIVQQMVLCNSKTSSSLPSHDLARKSCRLREKSGKRSGGQKGYNTDTIFHAAESKQEIVILPVIPKIVAHQITHVAALIAIFNIKKNYLYLPTLKFKNVFHMRMS